MDPSKQALFLSLRPEFAEMIIAGEKTVELRRIRPKASAGTLVIVYASSPVKKILGTCIVKKISTGTPKEIWNLHGVSTGVSWATLADYLRGKDHGVAITVGSPARFDVPVPLEKVRKCLGESAPPQSFRYIRMAEANRLIRIGGRNKLSA
ncbi:MAG TPA: ASCH domain-containing protein [Acidimicrobiales bacterium]